MHGRVMELDDQSQGSTQRACGRVCHSELHGAHAAVRWRREAAESDLELHARHSAHARSVAVRSALPFNTRFSVLIDLDNCWLCDTHETYVFGDILMLEAEIVSN